MKLVKGSKCKESDGEVKRRARLLDREIEYYLEQEHGEQKRLVKWCADTKERARMEVKWKTKERGLNNGNEWRGRVEGEVCLQ